MFNRKKKKSAPTEMLSYPVVATTTLISPDVEIIGNITFAGGLRVEGTVKGNVIGTENPESMLAVCGDAVIEGSVSVPNIYVSANISGPVTASQIIRLDQTAKVIGNLTAKRIEVAEGATIIGQVKVSVYDLDAPQDPSSPKNEGDEPEEEARDILELTS